MRQALGLLMAAVASCGLLLAGSPVALARATHGSPSRAPAASPSHARSGSAPRAPRAPTGPPLVTATDASSALLTGADASSSAPSSGGDPLVENGLGSPLCGVEASEISLQSRRNCATSGFDAAGAPTGDYALDVHIDTGALGFTVATLEQDYVIAPIWMGLVWVTHALVVALEWGFTLDLLGGSTMAGVERVLRGAQSSFTGPLLGLVLAIAAVALAYNGLVRRRVAATLGQAALTLAMMAGGLWVIVDPAGTVGALGRAIDGMSAGTLATFVNGSPAHPRRTLADSMGGLFAGVVGDPWCYLEFGAVRWCDDPALLDTRLRTAGSRLATAARSRVCTEGDTCQALEGEQPAARKQSATLLQQAQTNGELFLALPANEAARNSINDSASLLRALCGGSSEATGCRGPTAAQAEYRTQSGTSSRIGGLLLIVLGALGMLLLYGYIALQVLAAELLGLLYLLLAPAAVLAPAFGDGGRAAFRVWAGRLLGALVMKLLFSFLLGVVLLLTRSILGLEALGWWTRWLLVSALWWGAFVQRRRLLGLVQGQPWPARTGGVGEGVASGRYPVTWVRRNESGYPSGGLHWRGARKGALAIRWAATRVSAPEPRGPGEHGPSSMPGGDR
jgi:hypothetical protein